MERIKRDLLRVARNALREHTKFQKRLHGKGVNSLKYDEEKNNYVSENAERIRFHMRECEFAIRRYVELTGRVPAELKDILVQTNFPLD